MRPIKFCPHNQLKETMMRSGELSKVPNLRIIKDIRDSNTASNIPDNNITPIVGINKIMDGVVKNLESRHCRKCFASSKKNSQGVIQRDLECLNNNSIAGVVPIHMIQLRIFHASSTKWWKKEQSKLKLLESQSGKHMKNKESIDKSSSKIIVIKKMKIYRNRSKKELGKWLRDSIKCWRYDQSRKLR